MYRKYLADNTLTDDLAQKIFEENFATPSVYNDMRGYFSKDFSVENPYTSVDLNYFYVGKPIWNATG